MSPYILVARFLRTVTPTQLPAIHRAVLLAVAEFTGREGHTEAAHATLADWTGYSERHFRRALHALVLRGLVRVPHHGGAGVGDVPHYAIGELKGDTMSPFGPFREGGHHDPLKGDTMSTLHPRGRGTQRAKKGDTMSAEGGHSDLWKGDTMSPDPHDQESTKRSTRDPLSAHARAREAEQSGGEPPDPPKKNGVHPSGGKAPQTAFAFDAGPEGPPSRSRPSAGQPGGKAKPSRRKAPHDMPAGWAPNEGHRDLAAELKVDVATEEPAFRDYHASKGNLFRDWDAAFRTWIRNAASFRKSGANGTRFSKPGDIRQQDHGPDRDWTPGVPDTTPWVKEGYSGSEQTDGDPYPGDPYEE